MCVCGVCIHGIDITPFCCEKAKSREKHQKPNVVQKYTPLNYYYDTQKIKKKYTASRNENRLSPRPIAVACSFLLLFFFRFAVHRRHYSSRCSAVIACCTKVFSLSLPFELMLSILLHTLLRIISVYGIVDKLAGTFS